MPIKHASFYPHTGHRRPVTPPPNARPPEQSPLSRRRTRGDRSLSRIGFRAPCSGLLRDQGAESAGRLVAFQGLGNAEIGAGTDAGRRKNNVRQAPRCGAWNRIGIDRQTGPHGTSSRPRGIDGGASRSGRILLPLAAGSKPRVTKPADCPAILSMASILQAIAPIKRISESAPRALPFALLWQGAPPGPLPAPRSYHRCSARFAPPGSGRARGSAQRRCPRLHRAPSLCSRASSGRRKLSAPHRRRPQHGTAHNAQCGHRNPLPGFATPFQHAGSRSSPRSAECPMPGHKGPGGHRASIAPRGASPTPQTTTQMRATETMSPPLFAIGSATTPTSACASEESCRCGGPSEKSSSRSNSTHWSRTSAFSV